MSWTETRRWWVPAMGCLLLALLTLNPRHSQLKYLAVAETNHPFDVTAWSNQNIAAYTPADFQSEQNALPRATVEWTFGSRSSAGKGSVLRYETNRLMR